MCHFSYICALVTYVTATCVGILNAANSNNATTKLTCTGKKTGRNTSADKNRIQVAEMGTGELLCEPHHKGIHSGTGIRFHTKPPRYPDYMEHKKRQTSFFTPKWSVENKPDPFLLAKCGFFFTGIQDLVRCHQCGIGFKDWVRDDDVLTEHVRHSTSCDFLVQEFGKNNVERMKFALTYDDKNEIASIDPPLPNKIRSFRYESMESRLASFKSFPKLSSNISAPQLVVAGLYFTGNGDLCRCFACDGCRCFACDGGLKDWSSGDDPKKEHATYFPNCPYITQLKGSEYIHFQKQKCQSSEPTRTNEGIKTTTQQIQSSTYPLTIAASRDRTDYKKLLQKNIKKFVEDLCPMSLLDEFSKSEFLTFVEIRDIQELPLTSDKTRAILRKVMMKGERGYKTFKECLQKCNQGHLVEILEREAVHDEDSSFRASQVVQELGYAEIDVRKAKAELERKGKRFPTAEDIVNTLLDKQECAEQYQTRASSKENGNDLQAVVEENKKLSSLIYCMVCITGEADILFLPCTHLRICHECAEDLIFCPICNASIKEKVKISRS